jgi:hypothetical protein
LNTKTLKADKLLKSVKDKMEMNKQQIWDLLEIYRQMQVANTMMAYGDAFEELHRFIEENCLKGESENGVC